MKPTEQEIELLAQEYAKTHGKVKDCQFHFIKGFKEAISQMQPEWVSVEDRLPDTGVPVLVYLPKYGTPNIVPMWIEEMTGNWFNTAWQFKRIDEATHWMPLPNPPKSV
jgi:hypothetical protein